MSDQVYATPGVPFHGEFSSADASALNEANSRFTLYPPGSTSAITLDSNDIVWISDVQVTVGTTLTVTVFDGTDATVDAGERVFKGGCAANNTIYPNYTIGHCCQKGTYPKAKTSGAGQVDVQIHGTIQRLSS